MDNNYELAIDLLRTLHGPVEKTALQKTDEIKPQVEHEITGNFESNKEALPIVELTLPTYFAGKIFLNSRGATDHVAHPQLDNYYTRQIANSRWAGDHIYGNSPQSIHLKPAKFSDVRYKIFGIQGNAKQLAAFNIEWQTEGDYDVERELEASSSRSFGSTEMRSLDTSKAIELLSGGYDLWSKLAGTPNLIWVNNTPINADKRSIATTRFKEPATETLAITNGQNSLWDNKKWLQDDSLVASIANTYMAIENGKFVIMSKSADMDITEVVLIGQALSQMFAAKKNRLIGFVTDRGILGYSDSKAHHLTFTDEKRPSYLQSDDVFIDPSKSSITDHNVKLVNALRDIFTRPINEALQTWRDASIN